MKKETASYSSCSKGFTLIEFLIYITIVSVALIVFSDIGFNFIFGKAKLMAIDEVSKNARFVLEKISLAVRNAQSISDPTPGLSSSVLVLQTATGNYEYQLSAGKVQIKEPGGVFIDLTSDEVIVTDLQFTNISYIDTPGTLRISITMKLTNPQNRPEYEFERTFYTTANIRKK